MARAYRAVLGAAVLKQVTYRRICDFPCSVILCEPGFPGRVQGTGERFAQESWWNDQPVRDDLEGFLLGYLTSPQAVEAPLLVLGQPGSGKSVLTQVLAARLPPSEFMVVRVVLREVAADADLQDQIEHAIRSATGRP